jgi:hypothetical protein
MVQAARKCVPEAQFRAFKELYCKLNPKNSQLLLFPEIIKGERSSISPTDRRSRVERQDSHTPATSRVD